MRIARHLICGVAALTVFATPAAAAPSTANGLSALRELNVFTRESLTTSSDIEGKAFVGTDVFGNFTMGINGSGQGTAFQGGGFGLLTVGGSTKGTINISNSFGGGTPVSLTPNITIAGSAEQALQVNSLRQIGTSTGVITVGGNLNGISTPQTGEAVTLNVGGNLTGNFDPRTFMTVNVKGNRVGQINANNGPLAYNVNGNVIGDIGANQNGVVVKIGGTHTGNKNANNGGQVLIGAQYNTSAAFTVPDVAGQRDAIYDDMKALSNKIAALSGLPVITSNTVLTAGNFTSNVGYSKGFAAFQVDGANFFNSNVDLGQVFKNVPTLNGTPLTVVINVTGTGDITQSSGQNFNWVGTNLNQHLLWNFNKQQNVTLGNFHGAVLATEALVKFVNGAYEGSLVAKKVQTQYEIHLGTFAGTGQIIGVPEAKTWAMMIAGFGFVGAALRRRRTFAHA